MRTIGMCEPRNRDNGASDLWTLTAYTSRGVCGGHFKNYYILSFLVKISGADPGFSFRGAQKIMCTNAHNEPETRSPFWQGFRARLKALEALGFFNALESYLSPVFKHSDFFFLWFKKDYILFNFRGAACCAPTGSAIEIYSLKGCPLRCTLWFNKMA